MTIHKLTITILTFIFTSILLTSGTSCKKAIALDGAGDQLEASQVFSNNATANNAVAGLYKHLNTYLFASSSVSAYLGMTSDELYTYFPTSVFEEYSNNDLRSNNGALPWSALYSGVYQSNAILESVGENKGLSPAFRDQFEGEARFLRAFCYFYLVNCFGDVPLLTTTRVGNNAIASREAVNKVYELIVSDLTSAKELLRKDYSFSGGKKTRVNYYVATALLARVELFRENWDAARLNSDEVIGSGQYQLLADINNFATENNAEALWQFAQQSTEGVYEPNMYASGNTPNIPFRSSFLSAFEIGDQRFLKWVREVEYGGVKSYLPYKYKSSAPGNDRYTLMRLAEQYLIRAEANAQLGDIASAVADLNEIRSRAGVPVLLNTISHQACLDAIEQERRVELFAETGHRWFDLKRTGRVDAVLQQEKPTTWESSSKLFPIPLSEIQVNSNLVQNPGY